MSEHYTLYVFPHAEANDQLASEIAALSGTDAIGVKVALEEGGTLGQFSGTKAHQLSQALGLLGVIVELRASLPVTQSAVIYQPKTAGIQQVSGKKRSFFFGLFTLIAAVALLGWSPWRSQAAPLPGMLAAGEPIQTETQEKAWQHDDYLITPLAEYEITARVLGTKDYKWDKSADLSPVDLALGWGVMSDSGLLENLRVRQSGRWYYVSWQNAKVDVNQVMNYSANTHILPANNEITREVKSVKRDDIVRLQGYLVQVTKSDGFLWRSSLVRGDTGDGSCEVFWVTNVEVVPAVQLQAQR